MESFLPDNVSSLILDLESDVVLPFILRLGLGLDVQVVLVVGGVHVHGGAWLDLAWCDKSVME